jgi:hypothetical protein
MHMHAHGRRLMPCGTQDGPDMANEILITDVIPLESHLMAFVLLAIRNDHDPKQR